MVSGSRCGAARTAASPEAADRRGAAASPASVALPLAADGERESPVQKEDAPLTRGSGRVLVIEDEALVARELQHRLTKMGWEVVGIAYGDEAIELAKRYGPKHPKMIAAQSDLTAANEDLDKEVRKVVSGISREYEVALRNEQQLQSNWEARKNEMQDFNRVEFQLQELQRDVETNRQLYDIFFTRKKP